MRVVSIPLSALVPDTSQPRTTMAEAELVALAASIKTRGLLLPLRVKPADAEGKHPIVIGHRRYAALLRIGQTEAACIVVEGPLDEATVLAEQMAENLHREGISPIDEANAYRRYLSATGLTAARAAEQLQVAPARISRALVLLDLPEPVRAAVHDGRIPKETGYYLTRLPDGDDRDRFIADALAGTLTRDRAARAVQATRTKPAESALARVTCPLGDGRSITVSGTAVKLETLIESLEDVLKEARKARQQGLDVTTLAKIFRDRAAAGGAA